MNEVKARHKKARPDVRCCWICGKEGGDGFTSALRALGYDVGPINKTVAHAHARCVQKEQRRATANEESAHE